MWHSSCLLFNCKTDSKNPDKDRDKGRIYLYLRLKVTSVNNTPSQTNHISRLHAALHAACVFWRSQAVRPFAVLVYLLRKKPQKLEFHQHSCTKFYCVSRIWVLVSFSCMWNITFIGKLQENPPSLCRLPVGCATRCTNASVFAVNRRHTFYQPSTYEIF